MHTPHHTKPERLPRQEQIPDSFRLQAALQHNRTPEYRRDSDQHIHRFPARCRNPHDNPRQHQSSTQHADQVISRKSVDTAGRQRRSRFPHSQIYHFRRGASVIISVKQTASPASRRQHKNHNTSRQRITRSQSCCEVSKLSFDRCQNQHICPTLPVFTVEGR